MAIEFEGLTCECGHAQEFHEHLKVPCLICHALARKKGDGCQGFKAMKCPDCGKEGVKSRDENCPFFYRDSDDERTELNCVHPIRRCATCNFEFLDWEAEVMRAQSVAFHLMSRELKKQQEAKLQRKENP